MLINILFFLCALTLCLSVRAQYVVASKRNAHFFNIQDNGLTAVETPVESPTNIIQRKANIERPCKPNDYKCLQKYLKANSKCNPKVLGKIPKNYTIYKKNIFKFETPFANASGIDHNINVKNHNKCHFTEFFINRDTNKAVLAMDCPFFTQDIDRKLIQHATYKEDVVFSYHIKYIHPLVRFTMNIPNARNINICQATVFVDVAALPIVHVNPKDAASKKYFKSHNLANIIYEREQFADRGWQIMTKTISALLCNFGCVIQDS